MKQEQIKELLERIRSNKNNETNELVATAEEVFMLNATNEASVASYMPSYVDMVGFAAIEIGNVMPSNGPFIGTGYGYTLVTQVEVNIAEACSSLNISKDSVTELYLKLSGNEPTITSCEVYDENINYKDTVNKLGTEYQIPLSMFKTGSTFPDTVIFYLSAPEIDTSEELSYVSLIAETPMVLQQINVATPPTKTQYLAGENFAPTEMVVTATYSDGTTKEVTDYVDYFRGALAVCHRNIVISYTENNVTKTENIPITVTTSEVDPPDYKQHYLEGSLGETSYRVNLRTGRVDFSKSIKHLSGNKAPMSLRMVYNPYTQESSALTGKWKLNAEQKIIRKDENTLYYIDADFRIHTFKKLANSLYYDTDHTGMLIRGSDQNYVLTDDSTVEMLFDEYNRLATVRKYVDPNVYNDDFDVVYMSVNNADSPITVTDGMGRSVSITSSTIDTATLTYANGDLMQIADNNGETVNYTYDVATCLLTSIKVNEESLVFTYDEKQRVKTILYSVNNQPVKKEFISYSDSVTQVKAAKYSLNENEAYTINCYKFDLNNNNNKLIATFEKDNTGTSEKILKAKYFSPDLYENYTINLDPKNCTCGQYHLYDYENKVLVGRFNNLPPLNEGEKYVMFAAFDREELFSGIENGNLKILLDDGSNDITKAHQVMAIDANTESELPFEWLEVEIPAYTEEGFVLFAFTGDYNLNADALSNVYIYKTSVSTQKECITSTKTSISGTELTEHVESKSNENTTWVEINKCVLSGVDDCKHVTAADWQLTKRNMAKANNQDFVVWYNDLEKAIYTKDVPTVIVNGNSSHRMDELNWATLHTQNVTKVYEYASFESNGNVIITQNENKPSYQAACTSCIDSYGRTIETVNSKGVTTQKTYDNYDRVTKTEISATLEDDQTYMIKTSMEYFDTPYEKNGKICYDEKYTDEYGKVWTYVYNHDTGDMLSKIDPEDYMQTYEYNDKRKLISVEKDTSVEEDTSVKKTTSKNNLAYTANDLISSLMHNTGAYSFTYNLYEEIEKVKYNNAVVLTKTYDFTPNRDTMETTYANGGKITCVSDKYGNPLSVTDTQNNKKLLSHVYASIMEDVADFTERACQNKSEILRKKCHQNIDNPFNVVYNYDILKRLSKVDRNDGVTINYEYDTENRLTKESVYDTEDIVYAYDYYDGDVMTDEKLRTVDVAVNNVQFTTTNYYDKLERLTSKTQTLDLSSYGEDGIEYTYEYDENVVNGVKYTNGRVKTLTAKVWRYNQEYQDDVTYTQTLTYDDNGNIQTIFNGANGSVTYTYDDRNRLTQEENTALNRKYKFTYDDGGNITLKEEYNKSTGALLHTYSYSYSNDRLTNFNGTIIEYDDCGNPTLYKGNTLTWTRGRLLSQYGSVSFQYDGEGFRRKKAYGTDTVTYYYQDGKLLSEKHTSAPNLFFLYNGNEIVGFVENGGIGYFYRKDALGNVVAVYNPIGEEVASYTYDAWGNCTIGTNVNGLADLNPIRYRGYYYDKETQLYYLQTRYYDPATGRFISSDTVNYLDPETIHGLNLYAYCNNNPVMGYDPTGHWNWEKFAFFMGLAVVGTAATILSGGLLLAAGVATTGTVLAISAGLETTAVMDASASPVKIMGITLKGGLSLVLDFKNMNIKGYWHFGGSVGVDTSLIGIPGVSYSVGVVDNYKEPKDYAKDFVNIGGNAGIGIEHSFNPLKPYNETVKATTITFSSGVSVYEGYDYFWQIF